MKKQYNELIQHIHPTQEQRERMLDAVLAERTSTAKPRRWILPYGIAAAAAVTILVPTTVYAEEIRERLYDWLGTNSAVSEDVLYDVFTDSDGHVRITVKEVLSDSVFTYGLVEYQALDEQGKQWISDKLGTYEFYSPRFRPYETEDGVIPSNSSGARELEEYRTETSKVYCVMMDTVSGDYNTKTVWFHYSFFRSLDQKVMIPVSESVEPIDVKIDSSKAPKKDYLPTGYQLSPLGLLVYGQDLGLTECGYDSASGYYYERRISDDELDSLYLVMKDRTKYDMLSFWSSYNRRFAVPCWGLSPVYEPTCDYDLSIYTGLFYEPIDITQVAGLEIDGVYYPIEE